MRLHCLLSHSHQQSEVGQTCIKHVWEWGQHQLTLLHNPPLDQSWTQGAARFWRTSNTAKDGN